VLARRRAACLLCVDGSLCHVDVVIDDQRVVAISFVPGEPAALLYAQSTLLARAGLAPGGYDPPTAAVRNFSAMPVAAGLMVTYPNGNEVVFEMRFLYYPDVVAEEPASLLEAPLALQIVRVSRCTPLLRSKGSQEDRV